MKQAIEQKQTKDGIKVTVRLPQRTNENIKRRKIDRIYDILSGKITVAEHADLCYTVRG